MEGWVRYEGRKQCLCSATVVVEGARKQPRGHANPLCGGSWELELSIRLGVWDWLAFMLQPAISSLPDCRARASNDSDIRLGDARRVYTSVRMYAY
jgi:hypothetical protein